MTRSGYILAVLTVLVTCGCSLVSRVRKAVAPVATITAGATTVTQKGDAQTPANAKTETKTGEITIPAGSLVAFNEKTGALEYRLSKDTPLRAETRTETANGPAAFTPPAPPTAHEEASAKADALTTIGLRIALAVGVAAALFGLVRDWTLVMWGGTAVAGAGLFGLFVQAHPLLLLVIGLGVAAAVIGPWIYHRKIKPQANATAAPVK